ncbi:hypothetical protein [uncultured Paludibaculum sp.]|uniref:hypothetical protein n=1 Tax=uncultured Paludibaculum sp. TaxID=1765020 RepID=UPI002AAB8DAA|nr:hypothetical protein [uncultured Paludibaculum sp.]
MNIRSTSFVLLAIMLLCASILPATAQTQVPSTMVSYPPVQFAAIQVLTPTGVMLVQLPPYMVIDTSGPAPVFKIMQTEQPAVRAEDTNVFTVAGPSQAAFKLSGVPVPGSRLKVHRNGLRMALTVDYTVAGDTVTFVAGQMPQAGDIIVVDFTPQ